MTATVTGGPTACRAGVSVVAWDVMDPIRSLITSGWGFDDMPLFAPEAPLDRVPL